MKKIILLGFVFCFSLIAFGKTELKVPIVTTECVVDEYDEFYTDCPGGGEYISTFFFGQAVYNCQTGELIDYIFDFIDAPEEMGCPE